jgi:peptidoglycan/LPS O-acetylase OafA/YrhL
MKVGRVDSLDTLRGLAILVVVAFHVSIDFRPAEWVTHVTVFGNQGVQLFFLISAITMCLMWDQRGTESDRLIKFYLRRFFRIAPLFWLAIIFYTFWDSIKLGIGPRDVFTWQELVLTASFLHGFSSDAINLVVPGGWSIAAEMNFYVVFPLLAALRASPLRILAIGLCAYIVLGVVSTAALERGPNPPPGIFLYYSLLTQFPIFPVGMFLYAVSMQHQATNRAGILTIVIVWLVLAFAGKYALGLTTRPLLWLQILLIGVMVYMAIRRSMHVRILSFMGGLSYSMYLSHFFAIDLLKLWVPAQSRNGNLHYIAAVVAALALTALLGKLSGVTLETWSAVVGKRVIAWIYGRSTVQPSAAT